MSTPATRTGMSTGTKLLIGAGLVGAYVGGYHLWQLSNFGEKIQTRLSTLRLEVVKGSSGLLKTFNILVDLELTNPTNKQVSMARPFVRIYQKIDPVNHVAISQPSENESYTVPANGTVIIRGLKIQISLMDMLRLVSVKNIGTVLVSLFSDTSKSDEARHAALKAILKSPLYAVYSTTVAGINYTAPPIAIL